ncbi:hypothetical protein [Streptomyces sp. NPDC002692]
MSFEQDRAAAIARILRGLRTTTPRVLTPGDSSWTARKGFAWWLGYALHEPREFVYVAPRRVACHLFARHNPTCVGLPAPHPRRW